MKVNALVAKAQKTPEEGWTMADGTPWPGNNSRDHPGMIQVFVLRHLYLLDIFMVTLCFKFQNTPISQQKDL